MHCKEQGLIRASRLKIGSFVGGQAVEPVRELLNAVLESEGLKLRRVGIHLGCGNGRTIRKHRLGEAQPLLKFSCQDSCAGVHLVSISLT